MDSGHWIVLANLAATLTMFGVIWLVQLVHYPLFAGVGADGFTAYEATHQTRITWIVFPAMALELATAAWTLRAGLVLWMAALLMR